MKTLQSRFKLMPWLRLIRLPTFITVPGDGLVGMFAAAAATNGQTVAWSRFLPLTIILVCLYWTGMILNDCFDLAEDWQKRRWERPLVAGEISLDWAGAVAVLLSIIALSTAWLMGMNIFATSLVLLGLIVFYNALAKRISAELGMVTMGLCRGGAVVLGAVVQAPQNLLSLPVTVVVIGLAGYIMVVTKLAGNEERPRRFGREIFFPAWYLFLFLIVSSIAATLVNHNVLTLIGGVIIFLALLLTMLKYALPLYVDGIVHPPQTTQAMIGKLLGWLIVMQAGLMAMFGGSSGMVAAIIMLTLAKPLNWRLAKIFYSS